MLCGNPAPLILAGFDSFRDGSMMRVIPEMTVVIPGDDRSVRRRHRSRRKNQNRR
jgi:transketolase C-terminal domain/subunit